MAVAAPVSSSFCLPQATELVIKYDSSWFVRNRCTIKDGEGVVLFNMNSEGGWFFQTYKRRIYDATSGEVLLLMKKLDKCCARSTWYAFHGDSESESELLFTLRIKRSSYQVFLLENSDSSSPDFSMKKKSWHSTRFSILSNGRPIAEAKRTWWGSSGYTVTVYPEVDRAFIAALAIIWMLDEAETQSAAAPGGGGA